MREERRRGRDKESAAFYLKQRSMAHRLELRILKQNSQKENFLRRSTDDCKSTVTASVLSSTLALILFTGKWLAASSEHPDGNGRGKRKGYGFADEDR